MSKKTRSQELGIECRQRAARKWGQAWRMLSEEQQKGAIALEVVSVVLQQAVDSTDGAVRAMEHVQAAAREALYGDQG